MPCPDRRLAQLVGSTLPQPRILLGPDHRPARLDDALGTGFALIGVEVPDAAWSTVDASALPIDPVRVDARLDERASRAHRNRISVTDADGALEAYFAPLRGRFLLVRPDRMIAAVITPGELPVLAQFLSHFLVPSSSATVPEPPNAHIESLPYPEGIRP